MNLKKKIAGSEIVDGVRTAQAEKTDVTGEIISYRDRQGCVHRISENIDDKE